MALLTGVLPGTPDNDEYSGLIAFLGEELGPDEEITGSVAFDLILRSLGGDDTVDATALVLGTSAAAIDLFGMKHVDIDMGAGNDAVSVTGRVSESPTAPSPSATFQGIAGSIVNTGIGSDTVTVLSDVNLGFSSPNRSAVSIGLQNTTLDTGADDDSVTIQSFAIASSSAISTALDLSRVITGSGQDTIAIEVSANGAPFGGGDATGLQRSLISAGDDDDSISVTVSAAGFSVGSRSQTGTATGLSDSQIFGGQGQDIITVEVDAFGAARGLRSSSIEGGSDADTISVSTVKMSSLSGRTSTGLDAASRISGGDGNDEITIASASSGFGFIEAIAVKDSWVFGNNDDDKITLTATGDSRTVGSRMGLVFTNPDIYGSFNSLVDGGAGNDELDIRASGTFDDQGLPSSLDQPGFNSIPPGANKGDVFGVLTSTVVGGQGNDSISITSAVTLIGNPINFDVNSIGAVESVLNTGDGNDTLSVRGVNLDIDDVIVLGGSGNDIFDTGIGSGNIYGNLGQDLIKLDFFDATTMSIELLGSDSLRIVGTQDKLGNSVDWTQTISDMEQFEVAGSVYSAAEVVALLS